MLFVVGLKVAPNERPNIISAWPAFQNVCLVLVLALTCTAGLAAPNPKANPADPEKVLRVAFPVPETGFDPVRVNDLYSNTINAAIFQPLLTYDWMAMPTQIVPDAAESMPMISADSKTYTFKIKKGLYFTMLL